MAYFRSGISQILRKPAKASALVSGVFLASLVTLTIPLAAAQQMSTERQQAVVERLIVNGMTRMYLEDFEGAAEIFQSALKMRPDDPALLASMAQAKLGGGDGGSADFFLRQALLVDPDNVTLWRLAAEIRTSTDQPSDLLESYNQIVRIEPQDARAHQELISLLLRFEQFDRALSSIDAAIDAVGIAPELLSFRVDVYERLGRTDELETTLSELIAIKPDEPDYWMRLGTSQIRRGAWEQAASSLESLLSVDPYDEPGIRALADVYEQLSRTEEAKSLLAELERPTRDQTGSITNLETRTSEELSLWITANPEDVEAIEKLADLLFVEERFEEAAATYRRLVTADLRNLEAWSSGVNALLLAEASIEALQMSNEALALFPGYVPLRILKLQALFATGQLETALEQARELRESTLSAEQREKVESLLEQMEAM